MEKEFGPSIPNDESRKFVNRAESELTETYQEEIRRKFTEIAEYVDKVSDALPNKKVMSNIARAIAMNLASEGRPGATATGKAREFFISDMNAALEPLGYSTISQALLWKLQNSADTLGTILREGKLPEYFVIKSAAQSELERLRPWTKSPFAEERETAVAAMDDIYLRFPELRPATAT